MNERTYILCIVVLCAVYCFNCLSIIPERAEIKYVNEKYVSNGSVSVRRSSRRGKYVFNINLINKSTLANNITFQAVVFEHNSRYNQYVRTLMEFNYKWCELVLHDKWFGPVLRSHGVPCPTLPGLVAISNLTFSGKFPFDLSFDKGKVEAAWKVTSTGEVLGSIDVFVRFTKN